MNRNKAIKLLLKQKSELDCSTDMMFHAWHVHTVSLVREFFGEESNEYQAARKLSRLRISQMIPKHYGVEYEYEPNEDYVVKFMDNCIGKIREFGVFKEKKQGKEPLIRNKMFLICIVCAALAGYIYGAYNNPKSVLMHMLNEHFHLPEPDAAAPAK